MRTELALPRFAPPEARLQGLVTPSGDRSFLDLILGVLDVIVIVVVPDRIGGNCKRPVSPQVWPISYGTPLPSKLHLLLESMEMKLAPTAKAGLVARDDAAVLVCPKARTISLSRMQGMAQAVDFLVIWDFDSTIVDANTDTIGLATLAPEILEKEIYGSNLAWTTRINRALSALAKADISPAQLLACVAKAPLPEEIATVLRLIRDSPRAVSAIISDANNLFIDAVLKENDLCDAFEAGIQTNIGTISKLRDDGEDSSSSPSVRERIQVSPFCPTLHSPHDCSTCNANMCKGQLVSELMGKPEFADATLIYVGDGSNDFCGCQQLLKGSYALPRTGFSLSRSLKRKSILATVKEWPSPSLLLCTIRDIIQV